MSVSKADRLKHSRELVLVARAQQRTNSGEWPIRMRGYHRALKRQEEWAVKLSKSAPFNFLFQWLYREPVGDFRKFFYKNNPFLARLKHK